jgi:hypothetical protein
MKAYGGVDIAPTHATCPFHLTSKCVIYDLPCRFGVDTPLKWILVIYILILREI